MKNKIKLQEMSRRERAAVKKAARIYGAMNWDKPQAAKAIQVLPTEGHYEDKPSCLRCSKCVWIHEADSTEGTHFMGIGMCPEHTRAVNAHAGLVEALRKIEAFASDAPITSPLMGNATRATMASYASAALRAAGEAV
jgi:hypothetical protein